MTNESNKTAFEKVQSVPGNMYSFEFRALNPSTLYSVKVRQEDTSNGRVFSWSMPEVAMTKKFTVFENSEKLLAERTGLPSEVLQGRKARN